MMGNHRGFGMPYFQTNLYLLLDFSNICVTNLNPGSHDGWPNLQFLWAPLWWLRCTNRRSQCPPSPGVGVGFLHHPGQSWRRCRMRTLSSRVPWLGEVFRCRGSFAAGQISTSKWLQDMWWYVFGEVIWCGLMWSSSSSSSSSSWW